MALQPARGLASSLRGMGTWISLMGTNGPLSSIIQKSGSRLGIVLLAPGDPACGPDAGRYVSTEEPQKVSLGWLTAGRGVVS